MGGDGSGSHMGPGKLSVDSVPGVCIIDSFRAGKLFSSDNERMEWVQFTVRDDNGTESFRVNVAWLSCPYGGYRPLWRCPQCNRRVEWLYGLHSRLACRLSPFTLMEPPMFALKAPLWQVISAFQTG